MIVGNDELKFRLVKSSVPRGSVLGPALFSIFINDLTAIVDSTSEIFTDDNKLHSSGNCCKTNFSFSVSECSKKLQVHFIIAKLHIKINLILIMFII